MKWTHTIVRFQTVPPGSMEMATNALIRAVTMKAAGALRRRPLLAALVAWWATGRAEAQRLAQPTTRAPSGAAATLEALKGAWVRPDGGYVIVIREVAPDGALEAMYFNPNPLPFAKAQASREAGAIRLALELRAGGYNGSTYELGYDPMTDRLTGTYYQAVAKQTFSVAFVRK